jgi:hypothetical protein
MSFDRRQPMVAVRLDGRATRFVAMLRELGHLDQDGCDRLLLGVAELRAGDSRPVGVQTVRRAAAMLLFPPDELAEGSMLSDDWPFLFS